MLIVWHSGKVLIFYQGRFYEVHHYVALPQPLSEMYTRLPPWSSTSYGTWQFCFSRLPVTYCCPEWCHWVALSFIHRNLWGLKHPWMQTQNVLIVRWGQWGPGTYPLCSSLKKLCCLLLPYPHNHTDAYKASIFYVFMASPPLVGNTVISFILLSFYSYFVSTVMPFPEILNSVLPAP